MMAKKNEGCRDCKVCRESLAEKAVKGTTRTVVTVATLGVGHVFMRKCPRCGHPMRQHERRDDGSFKD